MTSEAREKAYEGGQPVMLFRFTRGNVSWRYTSSDRPETHNGDIYLPAAIERGRVRQGIEEAQLAVTVTLPSTLPVADNWRPYPPSEAVVLTIFIRHVNETDALADWVGRVVAPKFSGATLELTGEPTATGSRREGASRIWQRACDVPLYSQGPGMCNLQADAVPVPAVLSAVDDVTLTAPGFAGAPRSLAGGVLEWVDVAEETQQRAIVTHDGDTITVDTGSVDFVPELAVTAIANALWREATVGTVDGLLVTADAFGNFPSGRLAGGYVEWERASDGLIEYRSINAHTGNQVQLYYGALDMAPGLILRAYPGCAHTWSDCGHFENRPNYGGALWMPTKTPFDGNPVW